MFSRSCVLSALFAVFLAIIASFLQLYDRGSEKTELLLGVCVLSARGHRDQRTAIRSTWLAADRDMEQTANNRTVVKFVVGREGCPVHPADRVDQYGCQEWSPKILPDMSKDFEAFATEDISRAGPNVSHLSVRVMHPIILKRIGILANIPLSEDPVVVTAFRDFDEEELRSAQFSVSDPGVVHRGYRYQPVDPVQLNKGTQLEISVSSKVDDVTASVLTMMSSGNSGVSAQPAVTQPPGPDVLLIQGMREDGTIIKDDNFSLFSALSFMYAVADVEGLLRHSAQRLQRQGEWQGKLQAEAEALKAEAEEQGDILWVDGVDVYRSLPTKVLQCHDWFSRKHEAGHVMKTDDDSYVDVRAVADILSSRPLSGRQWWGNFRREWAVERVGKWMEEDYPPSLYPPFACGSGYVVSRELHLWLAANQRFLHSFQGEDVSLGIWLAPLAPTLLQDFRWQCFSLCGDDMLTMPDLTPDQLRTRWIQRLHCGTPCSAC